MPNRILGKVVPSRGSDGGRSRSRRPLSLLAGSALELCSLDDSDCGAMGGEAGDEAGCWAFVGAVTVTLMLAPPAEASVKWIFNVPGEGDVVFVTAADAALHGSIRQT
jgi:hypothetical protein